MTSDNQKYQYGYSEMHPSEMYDVTMREQKAKKMLSVLDEHYSEKLETLSLLDIGCSTGIISNELSKRFGKVIGIDVDEEAVIHAKKYYQTDNLHFSVEDGINLRFPDNFFDVVICAHVYEHVPDSHKLISEIHRVLKPEGTCYFAAGNRITLIEPHYALPLLSIIPKPLANLYLRAFKKGDFYYENLLTVWRLRSLVSQFEVIDYSSKIIQDPEKYCATEIVRPGSLKQKIALWVLERAYWLFPTYVWLLRKKG